MGNLHSLLLAFLEMTFIFIALLLFFHQRRTIGQAAFRNCSMLIDLECFDGLESVGAAAFDSCWRMLSVYLPPSVTNVAAGAFAKPLPPLPDGAFTYCVIPDTTWLFLAKEEGIRCGYYTGNSSRKWYG